MLAPIRIMTLTTNTIENIVVICKCSCNDDEMRPIASSAIIIVLLMGTARSLLLPTLVKHRSELCKLLFTENLLRILEVVCNNCCQNDVVILLVN